MADEKSPETASPNAEVQSEGLETPVEAPKAPAVKMQHVIITLADGRRGVFMGPELIKEIEMKLNTVPKLVSIDFDPPRAVSMPVPREIPPMEETPNADTKVDDAPKAGLE